MMTQYEAQKLRESMYKELNVGSWAVWQCAAGLLIVIGLAVAGSLFDLRRDGSSNVARAQDRPQASVSHTPSDGQGQAEAAAQLPTQAVQNLVPVADVAVQNVR